ncbi:hypothetical protein [Deinococcus humi]|uniref:Uncharacterized protein n=1 Tax=Deinococcus humi TaxID=662880 RepID=A0A7W8NBY7_9DEIO|nr:hypothetical protein [Deinococcus humi]MBB5361634.1 hypothetical protein [Deinococcus humi]GGO21057.1 hypothetical protein GCM10008949_06900 [Deinococcus humi]
MRDALQQAYDDRESRHEADTLDAEIQSKFARGDLRNDNVFEDSQAAVALNTLLDLFFPFEMLKVTEGYRVMELFQIEASRLLDVLHSVTS